LLASILYYIYLEKYDLNNKPNEIDIINEVKNWKIKNNIAYSDNIILKTNKKLEDIILN